MVQTEFLSETWEISGEYHAVKISIGFWFIIRTLLKIAQGYTNTEVRVSVKALQIYMLEGVGKAV